MSISSWFRAASAAVLVMACARSADAQIFEDVGTRAQGMGGAFVAVADDATASWWNPAGLATGALFNAVLEKGRLSQPESPSGLEPAMRTNSGGFAIAFPALGLSYYRLRVSQITPTESDPPARQDDGGAGGRVRSLSYSQFGATVGQSLGSHFVLSSTLKIMRGGVAGAPVDATDDALNVADDLSVDRDTRFGLDVGAMASFPHMRIGASLRNVTRPTFGSGADTMTLVRQGRAGLALLVEEPHGALDALTISADFDLTKTPSPVGDLRHLAGGGEVLTLRKRLGLRGGLSRNTVGQARTSVSTGVSVAISRGVYIEGARTTGSDASLKGWSSSLRLTY